MIRVDFGRCGLVGGVLAGLALVTGCGGQEAVVELHHVRQPTRAMPAGVTAVAIVPAERGPATDEKWSDITAGIIQDLIQQAKNRHSVRLEIADRSQTAKIFEEQDLAAAGMTDFTGPAELLGVQAFIFSKVNVKVEKHRGSDRSISGMSVLALARGRGSVQTQEVETVTRNMTVQTDFRMTDAKTGKNLFTWAPPPYQATEETKASPLFGSSKTEAELTPRDQVIGTLVERGARDFCAQFVPCEVTIEVPIKSSSNEACQLGVKYVRGDMFDEALEQFRLALAEDPGDHRACFAAGVVCERLGRDADALDYYKRACVGKSEERYLAAKSRLAERMGRMR
jgi:tetratricopeptide (TPR) repeat protein